MITYTGAKIVFSCEWPLFQYFHNPRIAPNYDAVTKTCNLFRNFGDVYDSWDDILNIIDFYAKNQDLFSKYNGINKYKKTEEFQKIILNLFIILGPGQWFDPGI